MEQKKAGLPLWIKALWGMAFLANIKSVFIDYNVDLSYAVVTSYRHILGDRMFAEMREPHQTSAFITDPLMILFRALTGGFDGVVIFLNISGVILYGILVCYFVKVLKRHTDEKIAHLCGIVMFAFRVRQVVMPEFTNMLVAFSVLMILFLHRHFEEKGDVLYLALSALSLCLMVLSYPSAILAFPAALVLILILSKDKKKDVPVFMLVCAAAGLLYSLIFVVKFGGVSAFAENAVKMVSGDSSHGTRFENGLLFYFQEMIVAAVWITGSFVLAYLAGMVKTLITHKKSRRLTLFVFGVILILSELIVCVFFDNFIRTASMRYVYGSVFIPLIILGAVGCRYCTVSEKRLWLISVVVSVADLAAVVLLTNLEMVTAVQYLVPAGVLSFIPVSRLIREKYSDEQEGVTGYSLIIPIIISMLVILHRGIIVREYAGESRSIFGMEGIVKYGPAKGIICSYMSAYTTKVNVEDWERYIGEGENILVVGPGLYDPIVYCFRSAGISNYSTIDTPTYDENLLEYWNTYPAKKPKIIAVECWYGDMHVGEDTWIMKWVDSNCEYAGDGSYYRFYRVSE